MNRVREAIDLFIKDLRNENPDGFNPIMLSQSRGRYSTAGISHVVEVVASLSEVETRPRIQKAFVEHSASGLRFAVQAVIANGWDEERIINFVRETHQFEITIPEIQTIIDSPEEIIRAKADYQDQEAQDRYLDGIVRIYSMTNGTEEGYKLNPKAYVIARMLINDALNEIQNPISHVANDYTNLEQFYLAQAVNRTVDPQFSKYHLLALNDGIDFGEAAPARLYDALNNVTVLLCGTEDFMFEYLRRLKRLHAFDISFKPSSQYFMRGYFRLCRIQEHLETGRYFNGVNLDGTLITKLYDDNYQTLWINVYDNSITFEEFHNEFQMYGTHIVPQVLHCEHYKVGTEYFIKHLDHEFIFYDIHEYERRLTDPRQKGNARKRIKTFKIDSGHIPFATDSNVLFDVLDMKFKHKGLVREYFEKVQGS